MVKNYALRYTFFPGPGSKLGKNWVAQDCEGKILGFEDRRKKGNPQMLQKTTQLSLCKPIITHRVVWRRRRNGRLRRNPLISTLRVARQWQWVEYCLGVKMPDPMVKRIKPPSI